MKKKVRLIFSDQAFKDLKKITSLVAKRIARKIKENSELQNPLSRAKPLQGALENLYRYRIGDYRAIFEINNDGIVTVLIILRVKHRKDVYK
jgi:mRNA interferase RelE/StbE